MRGFELYKDLREEYSWELDQHMQMSCGEECI